MLFLFLSLAAGGFTMLHLSRTKRPLWTLYSSFHYNLHAVSPACVALFACLRVGDRLCTTGSGVVSGVCQEKKSGRDKRDPIGSALFYTGCLLFALQFILLPLKLDGEESVMKNTVYLP